MDNCSVAIQILPQYSDQETAMKAVDKVIAYLKAHCDQVEVSAFETTIVGDFDTIMCLLKDAIELAGEIYPRIFVNVKISYNHEGSVLTIEEKVAKHKNH